MLAELAGRWGWIALRGVASIVFGLLCFVFPVAGVTALVLLYGTFALVDGAASIAVGFAGRKQGEFWPLFLFGLVGLLAGMMAFLWPGLTAYVLVLLIGAWAVVRGVFEIVAAIRLRKVIEKEWILGLLGAVSILFGIFALTRPAAAGLAIVTVIGAFAIISGILSLILGFKLKGLRDRVTAMP
jgi:uncharacterized membrane protein HdeD (DUF308 family)